MYKEIFESIEKSNKKTLISLATFMKDRISQMQQMEWNDKEIDRLKELIIKNNTMIALNIRNKRLLETQKSDLPESDTIVKTKDPLKLESISKSKQFEKDAKIIEKKREYEESSDESYGLFGGGDDGSSD